MPVNAGSHMLDLRLAESALRGEGRSKHGGRISGQMKREESRKQKTTKQLEKECRLFRDRMNFQERKFLSIQMFKKDLNPFLMVLKNKLHKPVEGGVEGDDMDDPYNLSAYKKKYLRVKYLTGQESDIEYENTGSIDSRLKLPDIRRHVKGLGSQVLDANTGDTISKRKGGKLTSDPDLDTPLTTRSGSPRNQATLKYPKCVTFPNIYKASGANWGNQEDLNHGSMHLETYKAMTFIKKTSGSRSNTSLTLQKAKPGSGSHPLELPVGLPVRATRLSAQMLKPPVKKSYSDVLIDTCRALGPREARMAEQKRVEAENKEGITELKSKILLKCRQGAEQDVFKDARWKLLIGMLPTPRV